MKFSIRDLLLVTVIVALAAGGCSWGSTRTKKTAAFALSEKRDEAQSKLLREIPLGTHMEDAKKALKVRGFHVSDGSPDEFAARLDKHKSGMVSCNWLVNVKGENGTVRDISVEVRYTGP